MTLDGFSLWRQEDSSRALLNVLGEHVYSVRCWTIPAAT
jgi:hypothetical protein